MAGGAAGSDIQRDRVPPSTVGVLGSMDRWTTRASWRPTISWPCSSATRTRSSFFLGHLPQWAGVEIGEISLGLCGFRPLCVCCTTICLMICLTHGTDHKHERHEQG